MLGVPVLGGTATLMAGAPIAPSGSDLHAEARPIAAKYREHRAAYVTITNGLQLLWRSRNRPAHSEIMDVNDGDVGSTLARDAAGFDDAVSVACIFIEERAAAVEVAASSMVEGGAVIGMHNQEVLRRCRSGMHDGRALVVGLAHSLSGTLCVRNDGVAFSVALFQRIGATQWG